MLTPNAGNPILAFTAIAVRVHTDSSRSEEARVTNVILPTRPDLPRATRYGSLATILIAAGVALAAAVAMQPRIYGQFHDDGIYLATAQSLADGQGYRHASLPTTPVQTKYPPLYAATLALVWRVTSDFPDNVRWFKRTSAMFLGLAVLLAGAWAGRHIGGTVAPAVFALLVGLSPLVFPFADYTLSELPLLALCLLAFWAGPRTPDEMDRIGRAALLGIACGLALLVRHAALPLLLAGVLCYTLHRQWRALGAFVLPAAALVVPWLWFRATHAVTETNPLVAYYLAYEPSVPALALRDPGLAARIIMDNFIYLWRALDLALYMGYFPPARLILYPTLVIGLWRLIRRPFDFMTSFAVLYAGLILLWPWDPSRYAMPLVPILLFAVMLATQWLSQRRSGRTPAAARGTGAMRQVLASIPIVVLAVMAAAWLTLYVPTRDDVTRVPFLAWLDYSWAGFEETTRWIAQNTEADAVLATAYDPMYFLGTGRHAIRPWIHRPWTYFYPRGNARPDIGSTAQVRAALDALEVRYLVIDPLDGYVEREAASALLEDLLASYAPPLYAEHARLRFTSTDGLHRVYELPAAGTRGGQTSR